MWCSGCQQDVPAIAAAEAGRVRCARCQRDLSQSAGSATWESTQQSPVAPPVSCSRTETGLADGQPTEVPVPSWAFVESAPIDLHAWRWDEDLAEAERLVRTLTRQRRAPSRPGGFQPSNEASPAIPSAAPPADSPLRRETTRQPVRSAWASWLVLSLGVMCFVFGGVLLGCSYWSNRQELWSLGLPFTLGGQAALIVGLVLQLDGLWQTHRQATTTLEQLDHQVDELRQATNLLSTSHSGPAQSFYFHMAEGASPHMLLSDLKGQLDLLAVRLHSQE